MEIKQLSNNNLEEYLKLRIEMLNEDPYTEYDNIEIEKQTREYFVENINKTLITFGMFDNNNLIAVSTLEIIKRLPTPKIGNINSTIGYICGIYTNKNYRKQGIARKLVCETLEYGKNIGITRFQLSSHNPIAIKMYKNLGFKPNINSMILTIK